MPRVRKDRGSMRDWNPVYENITHSFPAGKTRGITRPDVRAIYRSCRAHGKRACGFSGYYSRKLRIRIRVGTVDSWTIWCRIRKHRRLLRRIVVRATPRSNASPRSIANTYNYIYRVAECNVELSERTGRPEYKVAWATTAAPRNRVANSTATVIATFLLSRRYDLFGHTVHSGRDAGERVSWHATRIDGRYVTRICKSRARSWWDRVQNAMIIHDISKNGNQTSVVRQKFYAFRHFILRYHHIIICISIIIADKNARCIYI